MTGIGEFKAALEIEQRHASWLSRLGESHEGLWDILASFTDSEKKALLAHCVSLSINAVCEPHQKRPGAQAMADRLAAELSLDLCSAGWRPTAENYLGRVTKTRVIEAVREAQGEKAVRQIATLKKPIMVREAERLLAAADWLPAILRQPAPLASAPESSPCESEAVSLPNSLAA